MAQSLTSGRVLARNTLWNVVGQAIPFVFAIFAIPVLISALGTDRYGVLTLAWMVIGYFSLFDLGLGRALTQLVAERLGSGRLQELPALIWTALLLIFVLGLVGTVLVLLCTPWLTRSVLRIPPLLQAETTQVLYLLACSIPMVISTAGLRGVLEAHQRFGLVNGIRIPLGLFTYLGPLLIIPFSQSLVPLTAILVGVRVLTWVAHLLPCLYLMPALRHEFSIRLAYVPTLFVFGGWMTVTNVVGPLMVYLDRFFIGSMLSLTAVAYYVTPYEIVTKFSIISAAFSGVLFPAFANSLAHDKQHTTRLFLRGLKYVFLLLFPIVLVSITLAQEGLSAWLGAEFGENSMRSLQWLAAGIFINGLAGIPFALVQSAGRPDLTAILHLLELPCYLCGLWLLLRGYGIVGAAVAWTMRVTIDAVALFCVAGYLVPTITPALKRYTGVFVSALLVFVLASFVEDVGLKWAFLSIMLLLFLLLTWFVFLSPEERTMVRTMVTWQTHTN